MNNLHELDELTQIQVHQVLLSIYNRSYESKEIDVVEIIEEMKRKLSSNIPSIHKRV